MQRPWRVLRQSEGLMMSDALISVLSIGAVAITAILGGILGCIWSVVRELQRDLTNLRERVAGMDEKLDRGGPSTAS